MKSFDLTPKENVEKKDMYEGLKEMCIINTFRRQMLRIMISLMLEEEYEGYAEFVCLLFTDTRINEMWCEC